MVVREEGKASLSMTSQLGEVVPYRFKLGRVPGSCGGFVRDEEGRNVLT